MDPQTGSRISHYYPAYEGIEKVDQYTVMIHLKQPSAGFILQLANPYAVIQPEHMAGTDGKSTDFLVGTGPFMFASYIPGVSWHSVRNPNYFKHAAVGNQLPYLDGIIVYIGVNLTDAYIAGRLDFTTPIGSVSSGSEVDRLRNEAPDDSIWQKVVAEVPYAYWLNLNFEPFQDVRVRRACALLFPTDEMHMAWTGA